MKLTNKVALVTGASKGIGAATAIALAKEGYSVVINYKTDGRSAKKILDQCNTHSTGNLAIKADITNKIAVGKMFESIRKTHPLLHVLVNNAGTYDEHDNPTNVEAFESLFQNNFLSHISVIKHALKYMKRGKIVNVSSIHGRLGWGSLRTNKLSAQ